MDRTTSSGRVHDPGLAVSLLLLGLLLAVNAVAIVGILTAGDGARREALTELELETEIHARSLEAALASLRGDLLFLSQSPPLARALPAPAQDDPMARRWRRLDLEGTLLLFLEAHPPVRWLALAGAGAEPAVVAGREGGAPVVLPPAAAAAPPAPDADLLHGRWPLGGGAGAAGTLAAAVSLDELLRSAAPGLEGRLALVRDGEAAGGGPEPGEAPAFVARVPVADQGWEPPLAATLERRESESRLVGSVEALAGRYRATVVLNVAVIALTLVLGFLAFRQVRRAERLAAETEHQVRLRELERRMLHSERLASVGRLAAGLAHEINNPLAGMGNYLALLEDELAAGRPEAARGFARRVREGLDRAAGTLRRVLAFSSPGGGPRGPLDLAAVVAETVEFVRGAGRFPGVVVTAAAAEGTVAVVGNEVTLGQLVLNLILNACEAQPGGGVVEVAVARAGDWACLTVADRGPGLPAEARERLFDPFVSTRGSTGLGLAICHGIAGDHGGEIRAADRPGGGALFEVRLPLAGVAPAQERAS
jgi:signal transduction histidine kinase